MKAILKAESPKSCEQIANGEKTMLLSKTCPKLKTPFKGYIYETKEKKRIGTGIFAYGIELQGTIQGSGKVVAEFVCDKIYQYTTTNSKEGCSVSDEEMIKGSCLTYDELFRYENGGNDTDSNFSYFGLYAWHISELKIYDTPKELGEFYALCKRGQTETSEKCKGCRYAFKGISSGKITCDNALTRPPQSWCYVEELEEYEE